MATATPKIEPRLIPLLAAMPAATLEQFAEMGAGYFNPVLGDIPEHTLARIAEVSGFLAEASGFLAEALYKGPRRHGVGCGNDLAGRPICFNER